jgi:hypothetical protein
LQELLSIMVYSCSDDDVDDDNDIVDDDVDNDVDHYDDDNNNDGGG